MKRTAKLTALAVGAWVGCIAQFGHAIPAPDGNSVLILDTTVTGGAASLEAA